MKILKAAVLLAAGVAALTGHGQPLSLEQVVSKMDENFARINSYSAKFDQEVLSEQFGKAISRGAGELLFRKPGKMSWRYNSPEPHLYVTDGKVLWDYLPSAKQAMKLELDQALSSPLPKSFLFGMGRLREQFEVSFAPGQAQAAPAVYHLLLSPRKEEDRAVLGIVELKVDAKTFLVREAQLKDAMGNVNVLRFSAIKVNPGIDPKVFKFTPPKGVEVISPPGFSPREKPKPKSGTQTKPEKGADKK